MVDIVREWNPERGRIVKKIVSSSVKQKTKPKTTSSINYNQSDRTLNLLAKPSSQNFQVNTMSQTSGVEESRRLKQTPNQEYILETFLRYMLVRAKNGAAPYLWHTKQATERLFICVNNLYKKRRSLSSKFDKEVLVPFKKLVNNPEQTFKIKELFANYIKAHPELKVDNNLGINFNKLTTGRFHYTQTFHDNQYTKCNIYSFELLNFFELRQDSLNHHSYGNNTFTAGMKIKDEVKGIFTYPLTDPTLVIKKSEGKGGETYYQFALMPGYNYDATSAMDRTEINSCRKYMRSNTSPELFAGLENLYHQVSKNILVLEAAGWN